MALEQFNQQQAVDTYQPISAGTSPYQNTLTPQTPTALPTYKAPTFSTGNESFSFDPNQYLPAIKQQAQAIYQPQMAQLEALRQLQASQAEQSRVVTKEDFAKQMNTELEQINQRGAFFSGGGLNKQQQTQTAQTRALGDITTQWNAANFANIAQQAGLNASQSEYIQNQLSGAQSSAYNMFSNERNYFTQIKQYEDQKKQREKELKAQGKATKAAKKQAKKEFDESVRQFNLNFNKKSGSAAKAPKDYAFINNSGQLTPLPGSSQYNILGGLTQLNSDNEEPLF